jgi:YggT family protein
VTAITILTSTAWWLLTVYLIMLFVRMATGWVFMFTRPWLPTDLTVASGGLLVILEGAFTATDPPLKLLRRFIPPLRIGNVALDLGFLVLVIVIVVLRQYARA